MTVITQAGAPRAARREADGEGRIAFRLRIGVTGHRTLADEAVVATRVRAALERIRASFPPSATEIKFTILSALAEGADRLVVQQAHAAFGPDVRVVAVLPRDADDYVQDFDTAASRREFEEMRRDAVRERKMPEAATQEQGYERAGHYVVEQCDVLIALWDGLGPRGRGGTAQIVEFAKSRGRPVVHIPAAADGDSAAEPSAPVPGTPALPDALDALRHLAEFNSGTIRDRAFQRALDGQRTRLTRHLAATGLLDSPRGEEIEQIAAWSLPHFVRAEVRALRFQRWYHLLGDLLYLFAALAVTAVAAQSVFFPEQHRLVAVEVLFLLGVIAVFLAARFGRVHERWIGHRSLAEAFRSALFVALSGTRDRDERSDVVDLRDPREPWYQRAFSEAWSERPADDPVMAPDEDLRRFIVTAWLDDQIEYHERTGVANLERHDRVTTTVVALAIAALVVASLHFFEFKHESDWPRVFTFLAIALPGFGAAVTGIREHRQYRLHGTRSLRTAKRLGRLKHQMENGVREVSVQALVAETQTILLEENVEWSGVQEFQELEMVM